MPNIIKFQRVVKWIYQWNWYFQAPWLRARAASWRERRWRGRWWDKKLSMSQVQNGGLLTAWRGGLFNALHSKLKVNEYYNCAALPEMKARRFIDCFCRLEGTFTLLYYVLPELSRFFFYNTVHWLKADLRHGLDILLERQQINWLLIQEMLLKTGLSGTWKNLRLFTSS